MISVEDVLKLEKQLEEGRKQLATQVQLQRPAVLAQLAEIKTSLDRQIAEAEKLAKSVDLVFFYSSGYNEFSWLDKEDWSYSSQNC
jgi:hypothetical protein